MSIAKAPKRKAKKQKKCRRRRDYHERRLGVHRALLNELRLPMALAKLLKCDAEKCSSNPQMPVTPDNSCPDNAVTRDVVAKLREHLHTCTLIPNGLSQPVTPQEFYSLWLPALKEIGGRLLFEMPGLPSNYRLVAEQAITRIRQAADFKAFSSSLATSANGIVVDALRIDTGVYAIHLHVEKNARGEVVLSVVVSFKPARPHRVTAGGEARTAFHCPLLTRRHEVEWVTWNSKLLFRRKSESQNVR